MIRLTPHERDILARLADGYTPSDIALDLNISRSAVSKRLEYIYDQVGIGSGAETPTERRHEAIRQYLTGEIL